MLVLLPERLEIWMLPVTVQNRPKSQRLKKVRLSARGTPTLVWTIVKTQSQASTPMLKRLSRVLLARLQSRCPASLRICNFALPI